MEIKLINYFSCVKPAIKFQRLKILIVSLLLLWESYFSHLEELALRKKCPNTRKYGPEKTPYLDTFRALLYLTLKEISISKDH